MVITRGSRASKTPSFAYPRIFAALDGDAAQGAPVTDLISGTPHEPPPSGFLEAIERWTRPRSPDWFGYVQNHRAALEAVAAVLRRRRGLPFEAKDVVMTNGAFGGLALALATVVDPEDEVVLFQPAWHFYDLLVRTAGAIPLHVPLRQPGFGLDLASLRKVLSARTRAVTVNSPHNPTGRIYGEEELRALARLLEETTTRHGRAVYLRSDEAFSRIVFDGRRFVSPARFYARSFMIYSFGKTLLTPGARLGYAALHPEMPDRDVVRVAMEIAQTGLGYAYPDAVLQYAAADLEALCIDVEALQARRDRTVEALRAQGFDRGAARGHVLADRRAAGGRRRGLRRAGRCPRRARDAGKPDRTARHRAALAHGDGRHAGARNRGARGGAPRGPGRAPGGGLRRLTTPRRSSGPARAWDTGPSSPARRSRGGCPRGGSSPA